MNLAAEEDGRAVDEDVTAAQLLFCKGRQMLHIRRFGGIAPAEEQIALLRRLMELLQHLLGLALGPGGKHHLVALLQEQPHSFLAHTGIAAGHYHSFHCTLLFFDRSRGFFLLYRISRCL